MSECQQRVESVSIILLFALIQFQVSAVCDLHGFSPQEEEHVGSEIKARIKKDSEPFYNYYYTGGKKFNEFTERGDILTREIHIKQGKLRGIVKEFKNRKLKNVETFLGIPYAAPPVKSLRFMPPGSPPSWRNVKIFDSFGHVCPQSPPNLAHEPLKTMNAGYYNRLKGLMPFLTNQSEDCLYLNIYAPMRDYKQFKKYPVIVYIHGESFEWNSGNPYDGSVIASYGNVVVVTINFRLGILGFLKPGLSEHTVSNFGLLDQIAALQWIKDNIEEFGGDSSLVTLMGHGTGAACINFLMVSPVSMASEGLFHKAILMSGTALSDWALTQNPLQFTIQVAEALNCPLIEKNDELANCLRRKRLSEVMSVKVVVPEFQTPFGPIVDGSVVPNTPHQVMGVYQNLFTRYELLYGINEWETYHSLSPVSLMFGMLEGEKNELLKKYMYSKYEALPYFALATTLSEYLDWRKPIPQAKSAAEEHRDLVLDLLSDARYAAPVVQMALYHSKINPKSYFYVFQHKSKMGEFAASERSVSGEEIAYVFGSPLLNEESSLSHHKFSSSEQLLSEAVLTYFTNFAKTGNPNVPRRMEYISQTHGEWQKYNVFWPKYEFKNQSYLAIEILPHVSHHYRSQMTQFWNEVLPNLLSNPTKIKQYRQDLLVDEEKNSPNVVKIPPNASSFYKKLNEDKGNWSYGTIRMSQSEFQREKRPFKLEEQKENPSLKQMDHPLENFKTTLKSQENQTSWVSYLVAISISLLLLNVFVVGFLYYKRKRKHSNNSTEDRASRSISDGGFEERFLEREQQESTYSSVHFSETSQPPCESIQEKTKSKKLKKFFENSSESTSKVKKWFEKEVLDKYKKQNIKKNFNSILLEKIDEAKIDFSKDSTEELSEVPKLSVRKPILKNPSKEFKSNEDLKILQRKNVQKVSVGIDATPSTRGANVLKQIPIELTKSLDRGLLKLDASDNNKETTENKKISDSKTRTSLSLQMLASDENSEYATPCEPEIIQLRPKVENFKNNFQTFSRDKFQDINVTSRDSEVISASEKSHGDPLENIQKRNFPKVLPEFPSSKSIKRLSFPQTIFSNPVDLNKNKFYPPPPPPPPPRVSTLQRKDKSSSEGQGNEVKFLTFSSVNLKTPEKPIKTNEDVKINEEKSGEEKEEKNLVLSPAKGDKSDSERKQSTSETLAAEQRNSQKKCEKKREQPSIVIQPKIGPRKSEFHQKNFSKKAQINLQMKDTDSKSSGKKVYVLDSKGPSDKKK